MDVMKWFKLAESVKTTGDIGVEIETEGKLLPRGVDGWLTEHDGSLINGREYVFNEPKSLLGTYKAIKTLEKRFEYLGTKLSDSTRAGVHVHINMQGCNKAQLYNMIVLWCLFEDILLKRCGKFRKGNLFCLPLGSSDNVISALRDVAKTSELNFMLNSEDLRYCALNVCSLRKFGSLEFRAMRTSPDLMVTYKWAKLLHNMKKVACTYDNPVQIIEEAESSLTIRELYNKVFDKSLDFLGEQPALEASVYKGLLSASSIAYATEDWSMVDVAKKEVIIPKPAEPDVWANIFGDDDD